MEDKNHECKRRIVTFVNGKPAPRLGVVTAPIKFNNTLPLTYKLSHVRGDHNHNEKQK